MSVKILAVGDVCGEPGLDYLEKNLRNYRKENGIDFVVVNGENANVDAAPGRRDIPRGRGRHHPRQSHLDAHGAETVS